MFLLILDSQIAMHAIIFVLPSLDKLSRVTSELAQVRLTAVFAASWIIETLNFEYNKDSYLTAHAAIARDARKHRLIRFITVSIQHK